MSQYVFSVKRTLRGLHYCVAYAATGNEAVAVSRKQYLSGNDALNDVMEQLGLRTPEPNGPQAKGYEYFQVRNGP
jgi:hypothetical protein